MNKNKINEANESIKVKKTRNNLFIDDSDSEIAIIQ